MMLIATDWLCIALLLCGFAWFAGRWLALTLPLAVVMAGLAIYIPTGSPRLMAPPPGEYRVLGADIVVDAYIDALLKPKDGPAMLYRLTYSTKAANDLQGALDAGNGVKAKVTGGGDGGVSYDGEEPVSGLPPKQPEAAATTLP